MISVVKPTEIADSTLNVQYTRKPGQHFVDIDTFIDSIVADADSISSSFSSPKLVMLDENYWFGSSTACRAWHFHTSTIHKITIRHGQLDGRWALFVDGKLHMQGYENPVVSRVLVVDLVIEGKPATIIGDGRMTMSFNYMLILDSHRIIDMRGALGINLNFGESIPVSVSIPDTRKFVPIFSNSKEITLYQILVKLNSKSILVERRFSEFVMLDQALVKLTESSMRSTLPILPSKGSSFFLTDEQNIEVRRMALEKYLQDMLANEKVMVFLQS